MSRTAFRVRLALLLGAAILMQACTTLGPDYREPDVDWLQAWQPDLYGQWDPDGQRPPPDAAFWWQSFNDPALNRLIDAAHAANPTLRVAGLRILEARARLGIAGSALYPQLQQLTGSASYVDTRSHGGGTPGAGDTSFGAYQAGFAFGWELDFWGRFRRGVESADAAFFASIANQQDAQVLLNAQVADLYFTFRTLELRIGIARENAAIQKRSYDITQKVFRSGEASELDLQQARTQYLATLATIPELQLALTRTRNAIGGLLGRPPGELPELAVPLERLPAAEVGRLQDTPARLLMRRPDVRAAAWQVAAQSAQIGVAEADYYPAISLLGSLTWSGNSLSRSADTTTLGIGPGLSWNLFDHGRIANNVRLQDVRLQQLIEQYQIVVLQAAREIDDAAVSVVKTAEQAHFLGESVKAARRSLHLANARYREGYADFQRVLDAQRAVFSQTEQELVNQGNQVAALIDLYRALGGGWVQTPVDALVPPRTREQMQQRSDWGDLLTAPLPAAVPMPVASESEVNDE
ncbi:MAG: TolC family protein [Gammaproteobacteria bacterium]|nr:TolC family protein [Gammaproteobacteria bacterium]